ncbi:MAG: nucleoside triphosphate pyrophosphohydrolase [Clostridia bacterium]|nr:nucleoside triphosphate pyrophosphohydrolase [Clostridia bacterium]
MTDFEFKNNYNIDDFLHIMKLLRSPGGCPWDIEQTHKSIRKNLIEETYEVIEAIDKDDKVLLCEELGDLLMQIIFHTQMEEENGTFTFDDVCDGICKKLIVRHPHVFGDVTVSDSGEVLKNWDEIKRKTKGQKSVGESMQSVPRELPALMRAQKLQQKAAKVGFDWDDISGAIEKIGEETNELESAVENKDTENQIEELGDLLFSVVNVSRFINCDSEEALTFANDKFLSRFVKVEQLAAERGIDMKSSSLEELDRLWDEAKTLV